MAGGCPGRTIERLHNRTLYLPLLQVTASLLVLSTGGSSSNANAGRTPPAKRPNESAFGDVRIWNWTGVNMNVRGVRAVNFKGPDIIIETRDAKKPTQFIIHADEASGHMVDSDKKQTAVAEIRGNVRYKITHKAATGTQIIEGTAGHAEYDQAAARLHLTQGVRAIITDEAELEGPAPLRADSVTITTDGPQRFELTGASHDNDVRLTVRHKLAAKGNATTQSVPGGAIPAGNAIHLHDFRTGVVEVGRSAVLTGPDSTVDFSDPAQNGRGTLTANRIAAEFGKELTHAVAQGDVRFHYERDTNERDASVRDTNLRGSQGRETREHESGKPGVSPTRGAARSLVRKTVTGRSDQADYDAVQHALSVTGNVTADITDPSTLLEPAHVVGSKLVGHVVDPYRYVLTASPLRGSIVFRPRPRASRHVAVTAAATADANPEAATIHEFTVGLVSVSGFDSAAFVPGKDIVVIGDETTYRSEDKEAQTSSRLRAGRLTGTMGKDQTLERLVALGHVRFEIRQPFASGKGFQVTTGTSTTATLTTAKGEELLEIPGPYRYEQTMEDTTEPGTAEGIAGDLTTLNITTGELTSESVNRTASVTLPGSDSTAGHTTSKPAVNQPAKKHNR